MSSADFKTCLEYVLAHEGGYVNHPADPGGATNKGVTQRVYDAFRSRRGEDQRSVREIEMHEVAEIYRTQYWDAIRGDELPAGLNYAMYDFAVNSGPGRAAKFLQRILGVTQDGMIGQVTLGAVRARNDVATLCAALCDDRLAWMKTLRTWKTFGRGWERRVSEVREVSQRMSRGLSTAASGAQEGEGKALAEDASKVKEALSPEGMARVFATAAPAAATFAGATSDSLLLQIAFGAAAVIGIGAVALVYLKKQDVI